MMGIFGLGITVTFFCFVVVVNELSSFYFPKKRKKKVIEMYERPFFLSSLILIILAPILLVCDVGTRRPKDGIRNLAVQYSVKSLDGRIIDDHVDGEMTVEIFHDPSMAIQPSKITIHSLGNQTLSLDENEPIRRPDCSVLKSVSYNGTDYDLRIHITDISNKALGYSTRDMIRDFSVLSLLFYVCMEAAGICGIVNYKRAVKREKERLEAVMAKGSSTDEPPRG